MAIRLASILITGFVAVATGCHHFCVDRGAPLGGHVVQEDCGSCGGAGCGHCGMGIIQQTKMMLSCNTGCGEVYWDEWLSDPPDCCDPCDNHGNWTGLGACCLPPFSWCNMFGVRHTGVDSASCSSCSSCDDKAHSFSLHGHKGAQAPLPVEGQTVLVDEYWEDGKGIDDSVTVVEGPTVVDHDPAPAPSHAKRTYRTRRR